MIGYVPLPDGFAELPPGPALAAALARISLPACNGYQLVEVVQARHRQIAYEHAQLLSAIHELAQAPSPSAVSAPVRGGAADSHTTAEVSFALAVSHQQAEEYRATAWWLCEVFPGVHAALAAGRIDWSKVRMLLREVEFLDPDEARPVLDQLLATIDHLNRMTAGSR